MGLTFSGELILFYQILFIYLYIYLFVYLFIYLLFLFFLGGGDLLSEFYGMSRWHSWNPSLAAWWMKFAPHLRLFRVELVKPLELIRTSGVQTSNQWSCENQHSLKYNTLRSTMYFFFFFSLLTFACFQSVSCSWNLLFICMLLCIANDIVYLLASCCFRKSGLLVRGLQKLMRSLPSSNYKSIAWF